MIEICGQQFKRRPVYIVTELHFDGAVIAVYNSIN